MKKFEYKGYTVEIEPVMLQYRCLITKNGKYIDSGNAGYEIDSAVERAKKHIDSLHENNK